MPVDVIEASSEVYGRSLKSIRKRRNFLPERASAAGSSAVSSVASAATVAISSNDSHAVFLYSPSEEPYATQRESALPQGFPKESVIVSSERETTFIVRWKARVGVESRTRPKRSAGRSSPAMSGVAVLLL